MTTTDPDQILNAEMQKQVAERLSIIADGMLETAHEWHFQLSGPGAHDTEERAACDRMADEAMALIKIAENPRAVDIILRACRENGITL